MQQSMAALPSSEAPEADGRQFAFPSPRILPAKIAGASRKACRACPDLRSCMFAADVDGLVLGLSRKPAEILRAGNSSRTRPRRPSADLWDDIHWICAPVWRSGPCPRSTFSTAATSMWLSAMSNYRRGDHDARSLRHTRSFVHRWSSQFGAEGGDSDVTRKSLFSGALPVTGHPPFPIDLP